MVVTAEHETVGQIRMTGRPIKFSGETAAPLAAPPVLGQHTIDVLRSVLGCTDEELEQLRQRKVICAAADAG